MTIPFLAYPIAAVLAHPHWGSVGKAAVAPHIQANSAYLFLLIATAGTTITPFMQLYLQSAVVERGIGPDELKAERAEVISGSIFANLIACFIIIATGATLFVHGDHTVNSAADAAKALAPFAGRFAEALFAVGLLVAVQAVNGVLLPITLFFVWRLAADRELMAGHANSPTFNVLAGATVVITSGLSLLVLAVTLAGVLGL